MGHRNDRTGMFWKSSPLSHPVHKPRKARRSLPELVPSLLEPLEPRLMLSAPAAPVVTAYPSDSTVILSWTAVTGATKYDVYRGTQSGQETTLVKTTVGATTWTDTSLTNGTSYYYEVTALNSSGQESVRSNEASFIPQATNTVGPSNVLVIYNADWIGDQDANGVQDSLEVAQYYAQVHGVPAQNLLGIHGGPVAGNSGWESWAATPYTTFFNNLVTPVVTALKTLGQNNIDVLLFCYGIRDIPPPAASGTQPTNVSLDDAMAAPYLLTSTSGIPEEIANPYFDTAPGFDASPGNFNHQFTVRYSGRTSPLYMVSRLDGPRGLWDALEQIDQAQYAQQYLYPGTGYYNGTVYVDSGEYNSGWTDAGLQTDPDVIDGNYNSDIPADANMAETEHYVLGSGLPLKWQNTGLLIGTPGATFMDGSSAAYAPDALFFSGWYGWTANSNVYQWLPGSVADNLISDSMIGLEANGGLTETAAMLGQGLTAGVGTVNEPYLNGHPRPNILTYYLLQGYSFAEAAMLCTPYLNWMGQNVGDPLYTPLDPNKTAIHDTATPTPATGFNPGAGWWDSTGNYHLNLSIDNSNGPEVASAVVQFGFTTAYGNTATSAAFYERPNLALLLTPGKTYHMTLTLTNPVGTVWTSTDYAFTAPADPYDSSHPRVLTTITVSPAFASVAANQTHQFTAVALDQYGALLFTQPSFTWSMKSGPGSTTTGGLYTAPPSPGAAIVQATSGSVTGIAMVNSPQANLIAWDGFTGDNLGLLTGQGGGTGWSGNWGTTNEAVKVTSTSLLPGDGNSVQFTVTAGGGIARNLQNQFTMYDGTVGNTVYLSFVINQVDSGSFSALIGFLGMYMGEFKGAAYFGFPNSATVSGPTMTPGTSYLVVVKLSTDASGNGTAEMWLDPAAGSAETQNTPVINVALSSAKIQPWATTVRLGDQNYGYSKDSEFDEISLGTTWTQVTGSGQTAPAAPSNLTALAGTSGITLNWADNANNETGFHVQRATDSGFTNPITFTIATPDTVQYTDSTAVAATTYYYRVTDYNGAGDSPYSNVASGTTLDNSTTSVSSSLNPSTYGQSVTFTATVAAGHPGTGTPGGSVTFMDGTSTLGMGTLNSGIATFTTSALSEASHSITAVYGGDAYHSGSTSSPITQTVNIPGDINGDGAVDINDLAILAIHWQQSVIPWTNGDLDGTGFVDINDLSILATHWQDTTGDLGSDFSALRANPATVPTTPSTTSTPSTNVLSPAPAAPQLPDYQITKLPNSFSSPSPLPITHYPLSVPLPPVPLAPSNPAHSSFVIRHSSFLPLLTSAQLPDYQITKSPNPLPSASQLPITIYQLPVPRPRPTSSTAWHHSFPASQPLDLLPPL